MLVVDSIAAPVATQANSLLHIASALVQRRRWHLSQNGSLNSYKFHVEISKFWKPSTPASRAEEWTGRESIELGTVDAGNRWRR